MSTGLIATASVTVDAPAEAVWNALTDPAEIRKYYFGTTVETDWRVGSPVIWHGRYEGKPYRDHGTILEVREGQYLKHTHFSPLSGLEDKPENHHTLTYTLEEGDGVTTVTLTQDNNDSYDAVEHSQRNWQQVLRLLKGVVES